MTRENNHEQCQNCKSPLMGAYCYKCGQKDYDDRDSIWSIIKEWFDENLGLSGNLWNTLWLLLIKPGYLSRQFNDGHRVGYVRPIRLLIIISVMHVLAFNFLNPSTSYFNGEFDEETFEPQISFTESAASGKCEKSAVVVLGKFEMEIVPQIKKMEAEIKKVIKGKRLSADLIILSHKKKLQTHCEMYQSKVAREIYIYWIISPIFAFFVWIFVRKKNNYLQSFYYSLYLFSALSFLFAAEFILEIIFLYFPKMKFHYGYPFIFILIFYSVLSVKNSFQIPLKKSIISGFCLILVLLVLKILLVILIQDMYTETLDYYLWDLGIDL